MSEGLVIQDIDDKIVDYNHSALQILGVTKEQLLGTDTYDPNWKAQKPDGTPFMPEDHPSVYTMRTGKAKRNVLMQVSKPNGLKTWININSEPIFYSEDKNKPDNVVVTFTDITKSKNFENNIELINNKVATKSGNEYLELLIETLANVVKADHLFIGKKLQGSDKIETLYYYNDGFKDNFEYDLENTPCQFALTDASCYFNGNVQAKFPKDQILVDWNVNSYIGVPLKNKDGFEIGIITALFENEVSDIKTKHNIINVYATRAGVELERKEYEKYILERQYFISILFNTIPYPIFVKDKDLKYLDCNQSFIDYFELDKESFIGKSVFDLYPSYLAEEYNRKDQELLDSSHHIQKYEWFIKLNNGEIRNVIFNKSCFYDNNSNILGIVGVIVDITDQKIYQKKIKESEAFFKGIFLNTNLGIAITNISGKINKVNPALEKILGYTEEELLGNDFKQFTHKDFIEEEAKFYDKIFNDNKTIFFEKKYIRKDGKVIWGHLSLSPLRDDNDNLIGFIGSVTDITERKASEDKLKLNEEKYRSLFENANDGIIILDNKKIINTNQKMVEILDYESKEEIIGKYPADLSPEF